MNFRTLTLLLLVQTDLVLSKLADESSRAAIILDKDVLDPENFKQMVNSGSVKQIPYTRPCECEGYKCTCCAGIQIIGFGFDRRACTILTFDPRDSAINMNILWNDVSVFTNRISTLNRQVCVPAIPVSLVGAVDLCVRLYDMTIVQERMHACLAMMARVAKYPVVTLQFNCMELGPGGVGLARPIGGNYNQSVVYPENETTVDVTEDPVDLNTFNQYSKSGTKPE